MFLNIVYVYHFSNNLFHSNYMLYHFQYQLNYYLQIKYLFFYKVLITKKFDLKVFNNLQVTVLFLSIILRNNLILRIV